MKKQQKAALQRLNAMIESGRICQTPTIGSPEWKKTVQQMFAEARKAVRQNAKR